MQIRLVYILGLLDRCLRQSGVNLADLLASGTCMEASWILILIGLHAGSVMGIGSLGGVGDIIFQVSSNDGIARGAVEPLPMTVASYGVIIQAW